MKLKDGKHRSYLYIPEDTNTLIEKYSTLTGIRKNDFILLLINLGLKAAPEIVKPIKAKKSEQITS